MSIRFRRCLVAAKACMVVIASFDPERKIQAIKRIREVTGLGLADAKSLLDNVPSILMDGMYPEQAVRLSDLLKEIGMVAEIKTDKFNEPVLKNLDQLSFAPDPNRPVVVHKFVHEFSDDSPLGDFQVDHNPPAGATIRFELEGKNLWLSCNRAGWQHLARICAEMGMHSQFKHGTHFHMPYDWQGSHSPGCEVSFELIDDEETA